MSAVSADRRWTGGALLNPFGLLFEEITASSLMRVDMDGDVLEPADHPMNPAAFTIHSAVLAGRPDVACVIHLTHPRRRGSFGDEFFWTAMLRKAERACPGFDARSCQACFAAGRSYLGSMARHPHHDNPDPSPAEVHAHAAAARARKRAHAEAIGIDHAFIALFVDRFYGKIRADTLLGPIFAERVEDWDWHLDRMKTFWRSILHNSGEYSGNPMAKHMAIEGLEERHFAHWLELFYGTLRELESDPEATRLVGTRARMIADSLLTGIATSRDGLGGVRAGKDLPHV